MNTLRLAFRQLRRNPGFTAVAILTLALGIGANTTILGVIHAFFFEPLAVKAPERLVMLLQKSSLWKFPHGHSWLDFQDYRKRVTEFEDVLALFLTPIHLAARGGAPERTWIECVSGNYFSLLGVPAARGRVFTPGEGERPGADPIVILSHDYWERRFGRDESIVGQAIQLNGKPYTVVGVMPPSFGGAEWSIAVSAWVPATMMPQLLVGGRSLLDQRGAPAFKVLARLRETATLDQARAAVKVVAHQLAVEYPDDHRDATVLVMPEQRCRPEPTFSEIMPFAAIMFQGLVAIVLLIACANVANLMFARALARQREMGIRTALGASRWLLIRQWLVECVIIALLAGLVGTVLSQVLGSLMSGLAPAGDIPVKTDTRFSFRVFALTLLVAVAAGIVTGIAPALRATRPDVHSVLKEVGGTPAGSTRHFFRSSLVVSQVALCLAVIVCGGLFIDSLRRVARLDLGFRTHHLVMASLDLGLQGYDDDRGRRLIAGLLERIRATPGVESATVTRTIPFDYGVLLQEIGAEGRVVDGAKAGSDGYFASGYAAVEPGYFETLGVTLVRGRAFTSFDRQEAPKVAVVNQTAAERLWPGQDPVGRRLRFGRGGPSIEVVGVARDGKYVMLGEEPRPYVYVPLDQFYLSPATVVVRTRSDPRGFLPLLRQKVAELDSAVPLYNERTMEEHLRQSAMALMPLRLAAVLAGVQGVLGLALAVMGIYGVVSYVVGRRTREAGIRMALGARPLQVVGLMMRDGWRLIAIGLIIGLIMALGLAFGLSRLLYGVSPFNLPVFLGAIVLLGGVALLACYLPARHAARIDPLAALRTE